ncbi:MAG: hypothetical protein ACYC6Y_13100 [Thermoguttaceae bacterium]
MALLGLAVYSWAPLVISLVAVDEESARAAAHDDTEQTAATPSGASPPVADGTAPPAGPTWQELRRWCQDSPWTAPAELSQIRDPFRPTSADKGPADAGQETEKPTVTAEQAFAAIPVELTGTIVTPQRSVAILDGRAYRQGDTIVVEHEGTSWKLEIRRIEANRVSLGWESIERELMAPERPNVGQMKVVDRSRQQKSGNLGRTGE